MTYRLRGVPAVKIFGASIPKQDIVIQVANDNGVTRLIQEGGLFADALVGPPLLGDVVDGQDRAELAAAWRQNGTAADEVMPLPPFPRIHLKLEIAESFPLERSLQGRLFG